MTARHISIVVEGLPRAKQRARTQFFDARGNKLAKPRTYTPPETVAAQTAAQVAYLSQIGARAPFEGSVAAIVTAFFPVPKSWLKWKQAVALAGDYPAVDRAEDADNIAKLYLDALNGFAYIDDRQVCDLISHKRYTDGTPRVEIELVFKPLPLRVVAP